MNYQEILQKKDKYISSLAQIPQLSLQSYEKAFDIQYTHHSTALEGNTLTLMETKLLLEDKISVGGKKLREIYEVVNHQNAYRYLKERVAKGLPLDEQAIKDMHALLVQNIFVGGVYRSEDVYITGSQHVPPSPNDMYHQIKLFYADLARKAQKVNAVELAAWTHAEFVRIHPFPDGNGRTARLAMNYQLMINGFPPISISTEQRLDYYNALEAYAVEGKISPFSDMIANLADVQLDKYLDMAEQAREVNAKPLAERIADAAARAEKLDADLPEHTQQEELTLE